MHAALLLALLGCPPAETDTADTADTADTGPVAFPGLDLLDSFGGCADIELFAHDDADTLGLVMEAYDLGIARAACESGDQTMEIALPDARVDLRLDQGEHVTHYACNDAIEFEPVVDTRWAPTGGSITLTVVPADTTYEDCENWPYSSATITFHDVTMESPDGGVAGVVDGLTWDAMVGWLPG